MISNVLREDLDYILSKSFVPWDKLKNKVVMVTGSTGLIGKNIILVLDMLLITKFSLAGLTLYHVQ